MEKEKVLVSVVDTGTEEEVVVRVYDEAIKEFSDRNKFDLKVNSEEEIIKSSLAVFSTEMVKQMVMLSDITEIGVLHIFRTYTSAMLRALEIVAASSDICTDEEFEDIHSEINRTEAPLMCFYLDDDGDTEISVNPNIEEMLELEDDDLSYGEESRLVSLCDASIIALSEGLAHFVSVEVEEGEDIHDVLDFTLDNIADSLMMDFPGMHCDYKVRREEPDDEVDEDAAPY